MQDLIHQPPASNDAPIDPVFEVARLETLLDERRAELSALQEELREFKERYTNLIGSRLAELAEVETEIKAAEQRVLGFTLDEEESEEDADAQTSPSASGAGTLRKLFWSVAKAFHPDLAIDDAEAERRHRVMAEANRAYREGDVESLHTLLGDEDLKFYCTSAAADAETDDLATRLVNLKEELRTIEYGIKRTKLDGLYRMKLSADAEAEAGRDALAEMAERIDRQIVKARKRLEHFA